MDHPLSALNAHWPGHSWYQTELGADRVSVAPPSSPAHHRVLIVGGGLAGLSTAWSLVERGVDGICVCEAGQPGDGASGRNGGFVFAGYSLANQALSDQVGLAAGRQLHGWTREAVTTVRQRIDQLGIACQVNDAGVLLADWFDEETALRDYAQRMHDQLGFALDWVSAEETAKQVVSQRYGAALHEPGSFHFHPLRYVDGLTRALIDRGVTVLGEAPVTDLARDGQRWRLHANGVALSADQVVITTGGYDTRLWRPLGRAIQPIATYVATTEPLGARMAELMPGGHAVYDTRFAFDYYRPLPDTRLLWGGRISIQARSPAAIRRVLRHDLLRVFPSLQDVDFDHAWGGWMGYTRHKMPLLGHRGDGLWHATGFGGHGMAPTTLAGEVIAEAMQGDTQRLEAFARWQPVWAGHQLGRLAAQLTYWAYQMRDAMASRAAL